jgi:outer membrane protein insertion porin family
MMRPGLAIAALALMAAACRSQEPSVEAPPGPLEDAVSIETAFEGRASFSSSRLEEVIAPDLEDLGGRASLRAAVDDAAFSLEAFYREQGFPACLVSYETDPPVDGKVRARLLIQEGPRVAIDELRFHGTRELEPAELERFVLPRRRWRFLPRPKHWFIASQLQSSLEAIEAYYRSRGFLDAHVTLVAPDPHAGPWTERVSVHLAVDEGPRYRMRSIQLSGGIAAVDERFPRKDLLGEPVHPRIANELRGRLAELYARAGHPDASIEAEGALDHAAGAMDLTLAIDPGPLVEIGAIEIEGAPRTRKRRILKSLTLREGELYDVDEERESFRNLYRLGVFSSVGLDLEPMEGAGGAGGDAAGEGGEEGESRTDVEPPGAGEAEQRTLKVRLQEAPAREFYVEPGYGSYERFRALVGWRERNLFGGARTLAVEGLVSELAQRATIDLTDPRLVDSDTMGILSLFGGQREEPSFESSEAGVTTTLVRELREHLRLAFAYQYRYSGVEADDLSDPEVQELLDDVSLSSFAITPTWDTRDNVFFPLTGSLARAGLEWGDSVIGSELDFLRGRWALAHFVTLDESSVLGLSWRGGVIAPIHTSDSIPIQERFFNGGENTVRSYKEDELGPKDSNGKPIGGEGYNVFTVELRERLVGRLELGLFYDVGNVVAEVEDYFDFEDLGSAIGLGLRYALPVGPVRLDAGWNPDPEEDEDDYAIHLSVGLSF